MSKYQSTYDPGSAPRDLEHVVYEKSGHIATVTINRPEVRNALHSYTYVELRRCWLDISRDENVFVAVLTGAGEAFCAGRDLKFLAAHQDQNRRTPHEDPNSPIYHWGGGGQPEDVEIFKPIICALNGFAVGVGLTMALQCQLRVMADDAWIGDQHTNVGRLGAPHKKYAAMPRAVAAYLTLCNGRLSAQECLQYGLVNRVVPRSEVLANAMELAEMVCDGSPRAVQAAVRLYRLSAAFPAGLNELGRHLDQEIAESPDGIEGPRAFRERRRPVWTVQ